MSMVIKLIVILMLVLIIFALGSALYFLVSDRGDSTRIVKALTWRIILSIMVFVLLMVSFFLGWITPHSVIGR